MKHFPDPALAGKEDLIAISEDVTTEMLLEAYTHGIFPWPQEGLPMLWFSPVDRGVLDFADLHVPRRLRRLMNQKPYSITFNQAFEAVIRACQKQPRPGQDGTWITGDLVKAYCEFHRQGYAHSVECWQDSRLVGGLYGVYVGGVFCGESLFHLAPEASKIALVTWAERLKELGMTWMDIQMVTPFMEVFGGKYIPRAEFLRRLRDALKGPKLQLGFGI